MAQTDTAKYHNPKVSIPKIESIKKASPVWEIKDNSNTKFDSSFHKHDVYEMHKKRILENNDVKSWSDQKVYNNFSLKSHNMSWDRERMKSIFGIGFGLSISYVLNGNKYHEYVNSHIIPKNFDIDMYFFRFFFGMTISFSNLATADKVIIEDNMYDGDFYVSTEAIQPALGYEVFRNSNFSIIPYYTTSMSSYTYSTRQENTKGDSYSNPFTHIHLENPGAGLIVDYRLFKMNDPEAMRYFAIRFKYTLYFIDDTDFGIKENSHMFSLGLIGISRLK